MSRLSDMDIERLLQCKVHGWRAYSNKRFIIWTGFEGGAGMSGAIALALTKLPSVEVIEVWAGGHKDILYKFAHGKWSAHAP